MGGCLKKLAGASVEDPPQAKKIEEKKKKYESSNKENTKTEANLIKEQPEGIKGASNQTVEQQKPQYSWQKKKRDLSNFQFMNEQDKLLVKMPGTLNGQQFRIQGCKECNIYVHDNHDQCFIDECHNSVIVMGPCSSSTFIRNCKDCKIIVTCQQLRLRDCQNLEIMLFSQTQPVVESSSNINFICHQYNYEELASQMKAAKLSYLNNKWHDVFDFTPSRGGKGKNFSCSSETNSNFVTSLNQIQKLVQQVEKRKGSQLVHLKEIGDDDLNAIDLDFGDEVSSNLIPHTIGSMEKKGTELQSKIIDQEAYWIQETRSTDILKEQINQLSSMLSISNKGFQSDKGKSIPFQHILVMAIGIHIKANSKKQSYRGTVEKLMEPIIIENLKQISLVSCFKTEQAQKLADLFFRTFNIEHAGHNIAQ